MARDASTVNPKTNAPIPDGFGRECGDTRVHQTEA
jgi:hypothetical protein